MTVDMIAVEGLVGLVDELVARPDQPVTWYRGQGCATRKLEPSLVRRLRTLDVEPTAADVLRMEKRLLTRFRQRSLPFWPAGYPMNDWEHLFAMQHYRLPTRLLDWTRSALVAAYFALDHDPERCECGTGSCEPVVWALNPIMLNQRNPRLQGIHPGILATSDPDVDQWAPKVDVSRFAPDPVAMYGAYNNERITAQQGSFTVAGSGMLPLEEVLASGGDNDGVLVKFVLTGARASIRRELQVLGVSLSTVYPGLEQAALDIAEEELR